MPHINNINEEEKDFLKEFEMKYKESKKLMLATIDKINKMIKKIQD